MALRPARECIRHRVPPSTVPVKLHTALMPAKPKYVIEKLRWRSVFVGKSFIRKSMDKIKTRC